MRTTIVWEGNPIYGDASLEVDPIKKGGLLELVLSTEDPVEIKKIEASVEAFPDTLSDSSVTFTDDAGVSSTGNEFIKEDLVVAENSDVLAIHVNIRIKAEVCVLDETLTIKIGWQEII